MKSSFIIKTDLKMIWKSGWKSNSRKFEYSEIELFLATFATRAIFTVYGYVSIFWHKYTHRRAKISRIRHIFGRNCQKIDLFRPVFSIKITIFVFICVRNLTKNRTQNILERKFSMMPTKWDFRKNRLFRYWTRLQPILTVTVRAGAPVPRTSKIHFEGTEHDCISKISPRTSPQTEFYIFWWYF